MGKLRYFDLGRDWSLSTDANVSHTHFNDRSLYSTTEPLEILNHSKENALESQLKIQATKKYGKVHSLEFGAQGNIDTSDVKYVESSDGKDKFRFYGMYANAGYSMRTEKVRLSTTVGIGHEESTINGFDVNTTYPYGTLSVNFVPNQKHYLSLWMQYSTFSPNVNTKNPTRIRKNEIMFTEGNPDTKPYPRFETNLMYYLQSVGNFHFSTEFGVNSCHNRLHQVYVPIEESRQMIATYENSGNSNTYNMSASVMFTGKNSLYLELTPMYEIQHSSTPGAPTLRPFKVKFTWAMRFGKFFANVHFTTGNTRSYTDQTLSYYQKLPHTYDFIAGWGNGKLSMEVYLINIFRNSKRERVICIDSPSYSAKSINFGYSNTRNICIQVSYTFNYGKKVKSGNEVNGRVPTSSSITNI